MALNVRGRRPAATCLLPAVLLLGLLAACTSPSAAGAPSPPPALPSSVGTDQSAPASTAPTAAGTPTGTPAGAPTDDQAPPVLVLQGGGLGLLASDSSVQVLPFTTAAPDVVRQAVEGAVGPMTSAARTCAAGPRTALTADGFTLLLDGAHFVGWTELGAADRSLATADGLAKGSPLQALKSALPDVQVANGPTGTTWTSATGLSGTLSSPDPTATVSAISGGQSCVAP